MKHDRVAVALCCAPFMLVACGGDTSGTSGPSSPVTDHYTVQVTPANATLVIGDTARFVASVRNSAGTLVATTVQWSSTSAAIAAVDAQGVVTGRSAGATTINATAFNASASAAVTVSSPPVTLRGTGVIYAGGHLAPIVGGPMVDEIVSIDAQTGVRTLLTTTPEEKNSPSASPDGQLLVFPMDGGLRLMRRDGSAAQTLGTECGTSLGGCAVVWQWLSDGRLEYIYSNVFILQIRVFTAATATTQILSYPNSLPSICCIALGARLSPLGDLALWIEPSSGAVSAVRFADNKSTSLAPACAFPSTCVAFAWSASAKSFYMARDGAIYEIALDGTSTRKLYSATTGTIQVIAASPDGTMLAFVEADRLKVLRLADLSVTSIVDAHNSIAWSPDSKSLAFDDGFGLVQAINTDGSARKSFGMVNDFGVGIFHGVQGLSWGR